jgi:predicted NUDIX family NTP pyrophosphohydrolase
MVRQSAGVLLFRRGPPLEVLLVHPGGPFWRRKQVGAWQIAKGLIEPGEDAATTARREAQEELGLVIDAPLHPLEPIRQAGGKTVVAFAVEQALDLATIVSNPVVLEWPPRSGKIIRFPEIDEARWMPMGDARAMMLPSQQPLLDQLERLVANGTS